MGMVVLTLLILISGPVLNITWISHVAGLSAVATIIYYVLATKLYLAHRTATKDGLALAFLASYLWAIAGGLLLFRYGSELSDRVFHLWSIGWATPLILSVSGQIVGFMSGRNITRTRAFVGAILCWQIVPIGRALSYLLKLPSAFSWLVSVVATLVLIYWSYQLAAAELVILRRTLLADIPGRRKSVDSAVGYRRIIALFSRSH